MAGLHELRFTEEKPLLPGQDAELVSPVTALAPGGVPGRGCLRGSSAGCACWHWVHVCAQHVRAQVGAGVNAHARLSLGAGSA